MGLRDELHIERSLLWMVDAPEEPLRLAATLLTSETCECLDPGRLSASTTLWRTGRRLSRDPVDSGRATSPVVTTTASLTG